MRRMAPFRATLCLLLAGCGTATSLPVVETKLVLQPCAVDQGLLAPIQFPLRPPSRHADGSLDSDQYADAAGELGTALDTANDRLGKIADTLQDCARRAAKP